MYFCMHVSMYACMYASMYECMLHACMYVCMYVWMDGFNVPDSARILFSSALCSVLATRTGIHLLRDLPSAHTWQFELQHWISKVQWASFQLHCHLARYILAKDKHHDMRCQRQTGWRTNVGCQRRIGWRSNHATRCQRQSGWRTQSERTGAKPVIANTNFVNEHQSSQIIFPKQKCSQIVVGEKWVGAVNANASCLHGWIG